MWHFLHKPEAVHLLLHERKPQAVCHTACFTSQA